MTPILDTRDQTVLVLPQTSFADGAALLVHEAVLADLGMHADLLIVRPARRTRCARRRRKPSVGASPGALDKLWSPPSAR